MTGWARPSKQADKHLLKLPFKFDYYIDSTISLLTASTRVGISAMILIYLILLPSQIRNTVTSSIFRDLIFRLILIKGLWSM